MLVAVSFGDGGISSAALGEAKVEHDGSVAAARLPDEHDVLRLQVAMDDLQLVRVVEPRTHLAQQFDPRFEVHGAGFHFPVREELAFEERHDEVDQAVL